MRNLVFAAFVAATITSAPAPAIVIRHDKDAAQYLADAGKYPAVIDLGGVAATVIAPQWVVTAAHAMEELEDQPLNDWSVTIGGRELSFDKVILLPDRARGSVNSDFDLALVHLAQPTDVRPIPLYRWSDEASRRGTIIGRGATATGNSNRDQIQRDGQLRAATNVIDGAFEHSLVTIFNAPPRATDLEGTPGPGDSGGPLLIERDGQHYLAGIVSFNAREHAEFYDSLHAYSRISSHRAWIEQVMAKNPPSTIRQWSAWHRSDRVPGNGAGQIAGTLLSALAKPDRDALVAFYQRHGSTISTTTPEARAQRIREYFRHQRYDVVGYRTIAEDRATIIMREPQSKQIFALIIGTEEADPARMKTFTVGSLDGLPDALASES